MKQTIQDVVNFFKEVPSRYTYSFDRIQAKFEVSREEIQEAKKLFMGSLFETLPVSQSEMQVERMWVNSNGKTSVQMKPLTETFSYDPIEYKAWDIEIKPSSKICMVYTSDKHIGASVGSEAMLNNHYDKEEFESRMQKLAVELIDLDNLHRFDQMIVCDLGDAIDGMDGFTGSRMHKLPQNMGNREVFQTFIDVHLKFFHTLKSHLHCPNLEFRTAGESNHGGDMEWMCFKTLGMMLHEKYNMNVYIGNKFIEHFTKGDHTFLLCHGKDFKDMKFGLPRYADAKTINYFKSYMEHHGITSKFIHVVKGDLHMNNSEYTQFFRYKNVMSMFGSSKWVMTNFMSNTKGVSIDILNLGTNSITEHYLFF